VSSDTVLGDWGNSRLRLWRMEGGAVTERREGPGRFRGRDPKAVLEALLGGWKAERVILCGMAGARNGLREAPYVRCPAALSDWSEQAAERVYKGYTLTIAPGMADGEGPDVMRGEEAQVFGAMALHPALLEGQHRLLLPGTHSKWVELEDGRIVRFQTYITGELFELLNNSSLFAVAPGDAEPNEAGFAAGLARAAREGELTGALFEARSGQLIGGESPAWARGFVSGLLIGAEVRSRARDVGESFVIIGDRRLTALYRTALSHFGASASVLAGETCAIAGLRLLDAHD
jgi:2-dehydro-3-deoxygalactonokinase